MKATVWEEIARDMSVLALAYLAGYAIAATISGQATSRRASRPPPMVSRVEDLERKIVYLRSDLLEVQSRREGTELAYRVNQTRRFINVRSYRARSLQSDIDISPEGSLDVW